MPALTQRTAAQWKRALERAIAEGLDVLVGPVSGEAFVESVQHPGALYRVTATRGACPAGQQGQVCKHVACHLARVGEFPIPPAPVACRDCSGCGVQVFRTFEQRCDVCQGAGLVAA